MVRIPVSSLIFYFLLLPIRVMILILKIFLANIFPLMPPSLFAPLKFFVCLFYGFERFSYSEKKMSIRVPKVSPNSDLTIYTVDELRKKHFTC